MTKQELIKLINMLPEEDKHGNMTCEFYNRHGERYITDSIRLDMDGGRIIIAQQGSGYYEKNKENWYQEIQFYENAKNRRQDRAL